MLALWHSITQTAGLSINQRSFIQAAQGLPDPQPFLLSAPIPTNRYRRSLAVTSAVMVAALLHGGLLFWYVSRPAPLPFSAAAPLPMISMELSAPPSPVVNQPIAPPQPAKPVVPPKLDKPKVKPKPKPKPSERLVKQVDERKTVQEPEPATPAQPTAAAPQALNHNALAAPRNDTYVPADSNAAYLNNPKPKYPMIARQRHWQGMVLLRVYVGADGKALQVNIQRSSNHDTLDESALEAVKQWRFVPAKRGDSAEASWVTVPIVFELD
ncbi:MAG: energy transducer TonB [Gammaproteobacteria bacterium HGW-Gammaproteobacteria-10]|nr:MAG: energy transducer TonB [Gammaproteobacteria bacterium HGW-Gammaproteobacteria-3]PKM35143.1 MAG: energy transducer TonB [Gammaproteobacteria bacterium HGW-Gammaproteobacteria-10]